MQIEGVGERAGARCKGWSCGGRVSHPGFVSCLCGSRVCLVIVLGAVSVPRGYLFCFFPPQLALT